MSLSFQGLVYKLFLGVWRSYSAFHPFAIIPRIRKQFPFGFSSKSRGGFFTAGNASEKESIQSSHGASKVHRVHRDTERKKKNGNNKESYYPKALSCITRPSLPASQLRGSAVSNRQRRGKVLHRFVQDQVNQLSDTTLISSALIATQSGTAAS